MTEKKFKERVWKMKEWNHKLKDWIMMHYLLIEKDVAYVILSPSTTIMEEPIGATWDGAT